MGVGVEGVGKGGGEGEMGTGRFVANFHNVVLRAFVR